MFVSRMVPIVSGDLLEEFELVKEVIQNPRRHIHREHLDCDVSRLVVSTE